MSLLACDIEDLSVHPMVKTLATARPLKDIVADQKHFRRNPAYPGNERKDDWNVVNPHVLSERAAIAEARRCLKCADAPCQRSCPASIDVKQFISCISSGNYYGAAKMILSENPLGFTCGVVCPTSRLCAGSCNLAHTEQGPINIGGLQHFALTMYSQMKVPLLKDTLKTYEQPISVVGAGPAGLAVATYMARMGYKNVEVLEKFTVPGGLNLWGVPQYRLPVSTVEFEMTQLQELGVKITCGKELGKDYTLADLRKKSAAVFCGIGQPKPNSISAFDGLTEEDGYYNSQQYLLRGQAEIKGYKVDKPAPPVAGAKVVVLGAGDAACDCAGTSNRLGAKRVIVILRRTIPQMRASEEEQELLRWEGVEVLPYCSPTKVIRDEKTGKIKALVASKMEMDDEGRFYVDDEQTVTVKCDFIVSAFGQSMGSPEDSWAKGLDGVKFDKATQPIVDDNNKGVGLDNVWFGGSMLGADTTVASVCDGKVAAAAMHKYLQGEAAEEQTGPVATLPPFRTEIDNVDISIEVCGIKFPNPFGLASAPPTTSAAMIARAFDAGWGFAVTKTFALDKDAVTNICPRIVRGTTSGINDGTHQGAFLNIELISEKTATYWLKSIRELKDAYPDKIVIASIMSAYIEEDWKLLAQLSEKAGADAIELNLSCPHGMAEQGMGLACGQNPKFVEGICRWVKSVTTIPVWGKLTSNVTDIVQIASAAKRGGADGVTAINTMSGLMGLQPGTTKAWPAVGAAGLTAYGGVSGNAIRPTALRCVSSIYKELCDDNFTILATGGCETPANALEFIKAGACAVQICSAVQNQDFSIIYDLITGLKTLMYLESREDLADWRGQAPPAQEYQLPFQKPVVKAELPWFGQFDVQRRRESVKQQLAARANPQPQNVKPYKLHPVPSLKSFVGGVVSRISTFAHMDHDDQVVAVIDLNLCINCGKCMMVCVDSAYQAISFDPKTHHPCVSEGKCTGCGLCQAVCPVPNCITMQKRKGPLKGPVRGPFPIGTPLPFQD
eukprot:TRINITY_DN19351_c0_g1_i1.p1 TRINITY_DN19351_c0_g1~~TRINITY_DN19351_c0_g1_i1.p1  ORF type:complete len:1021 (-),score=146.47 TRINITY_DN19351_c0_g1_i1:185-3217(-)